MANEELRLEDATLLERDVYNLWEIDQSGTGINLAFGFRVMNIDVHRFEHALNSVIARHGRLRSVFRKEGRRVLRVEFPSLEIRVEPFKSKNPGDFVRPFDLERGPLLRAAISGDTVFLDFCHIITDGFSMILFFSELDDFYSGRKPRYEPTSVPTENETEIFRNTAFWAGQFDSSFSPLVLPHDKNGTGIYGGDGESITARIFPSDTRRVQKVCRRLGITPFVFYFSAFLLLLSRECGTNDVVTATNLACRSSRTLRTIALFSAVVPVRFRVGDKLNTDDFLRSVSHRVQEFLIHQHFNSARLLSDIGVHDIRDVSRTLFTYEHKKIADARLCGEKCEFVPVPSRHSSTDFTLCFFPLRDESRLLLIFRADLFSRFRARELLHRYVRTVRELSVSG